MRSHRIIIQCVFIYLTSPLEQQIDVIYCAKGSMCSRRSKATILSNKDNLNQSRFLKVPSSKAIYITNKHEISQPNLYSNSHKGEQFLNCRMLKYVLYSMIEIFDKFVVFISSYL